MENVISMNQGNADKTVEEVFEVFIEYSKAKNLANRTIGYYENNFDRFKKFLLIAIKVLYLDFLIP